MDQLSSQLIVNILRKKMALPIASVWLRDQNRMIPNDNGLYISVGIINSLVMSNESYIREGVPSKTWDMLGRQWDKPNETYDVPAPSQYDQPGQSFDVPGQTYIDPAPSQYDQPGQSFDVPGQTYDQPLPVTSMTEVNKAQVQEFVQIDIFSRSNDAIYRNWEVVTALQSIYAQQVQQLHQFKIFRMPRTFLNTSYAEGGSQLNRYTITICCFVWYVKETLLSSDNGDYYDDFHQRVDDKNTIGTDQPIIAFEINQQGIVT